MRIQVKRTLSVLLSLALLFAAFPAGTLISGAADAGGNAYGFAGDNLVSSMEQFTRSNPYTVSGTNKDQYTDTGYYTSTLTEGKTYVISAKCDLPWATSHNTSGTNPGTAAVWLYIRNAGGSIISYRFFDMTGGDATFTAPAGTANTAQVRLQIYGDGTNTYTGRFWDLRLFCADDAGTLTVKAGEGVESVYASGMKNYLPGATYTEKNPYVISGTTNDDYRILDIYTAENMIPGASYTIYAKSNLAWATVHRTDGSTANTAAVWLYFRDTSGNVKDYHFFNMTGDSATFTVPAGANGTAQLRLQAYGNGSATHTAKFWDICLIKNGDGNVAQSDTNVLTNAFSESSPYTLSGNTVDRYEYIDSYSKYNLSPGDKYVIGAKSSAPWADVHRTDGSQPGKAGLWLLFRNAAGSNVTHMFFNLTAGGQTTFTVPAGANGKCQIRVQLYSNGSTNYTVKFWDIYLYKPADAPKQIVNTVSHGYPMTVGATVQTGYHWGSWSGALSSSEQNFRFNMPASANAALTATAQPNSYTVNFAGGGNTGGSTAPLTAYYNRDAALTANGFTKTGYHFTGWRSENGTSYADKATIRNLTTENGKSFTFTAQWAANAYTVAFDGNGNTGGAVPASFGATYDNAFDLPSAQPTKTGYTFKGWTVSEDGSGTVYAPGQSVKNLTASDGATATLHAKWEINNYPVTFTASGVGYTVSQAPADNADHGSAVSFKITLNEGYSASADPAVTATVGTVVAEKNGDEITYTVSGITAATEITVGDADINTYTVEFVSPYADETLKTETVEHGAAAAAPEVDQYVKIDGDNAKHMKFTGWDREFGSVSGDLTVTAVYEEEAHDFTGFTTDGDETHTHTCRKCGYVETLGHNWVLESSEGSTCIAHGSEIYKCADCNAEKTVELPYADHQYTAQTVSADRLVSAATCQQKAVYYYSCAVCGEAGSETFEYGDFAGHKFETYVSNNDATCQRNCTETAECSYGCGETDTRDIPNSTVGHRFETYVSDDNASCTGLCTETAACAFGCGETDTRDIPDSYDYTNHSTTETVTKNAKAATCYEDGYTGDIYCAACDHLIEAGSPIAKETVAHTPVKTEAKAATCTSKGNIEFYTCSECGRIFTEEACENEITAEETVLDFDYTNHSTDETVTKNAKPATCTDDGYTGDICCKACGRLIEAGEIIPSGGAEHVFGEWYVRTAAGCTEDGVEERVCENCGETETRPIPALGHDWGEWTDDAEDAPSCTKDGRQNRVCARCGETETREITASEKGHTIRVPNEENEGYCASCGQYRCLFCEKDEHMHRVSDNSVMTFFIHVVHYFYHLFSNFRYTLSHR